MNCLNPKTIENKNTGEEIQIRCRKCILCRQKRSRDWSLKLIKESIYHKKMCMITLTFSPKFLLRPYWVKLYKYKRIPDKNEILGYRIKKIKYKTCINPTYIQNVNKTGWLVTRFIKKLRRFVKEEYDEYITFFAAGEHGTQKTHRAHWHIIFFGIDEKMLKSALKGKSKKNKNIYFSPIIHKLWSFKDLNIGDHTISEVTPATIKYVANYTLKKLKKGDKEDVGHSDDNASSNKWNNVYNTTFRYSNNGKIGIKWIRRFHKEIRKGYLEDQDKVKYGVPEAWKKELKRYSREYDIVKDKIIFYENNSGFYYDTIEQEKSLAMYEDKEQEYILKNTYNGLNSKDEALKKAHILEYRQRLQDRDF